MKLDEPIAIITKDNFELWAKSALQVSGGALLVRDLAGFMEPVELKSITWTTVSQMVQDYHNQFPEKEEVCEPETERTVFQGKKRGRKPKSYIPESYREKPDELISDFDGEEIDPSAPLKFGD